MRTKHIENVIPMDINNSSFPFDQLNINEAFVFISGDGKASNTKVEAHMKFFNMYNGRGFKMTKALKQLEPKGPMRTIYVRIK